MPHPPGVSRRPGRQPQRRTKQTWTLRAPRLEHAGDRQQVTAELAGTEVWFEAEGAALEACPEAFASAFLLQALHQGALIESEAPLDARWLGDLPKLLAVYRDWWGYDDPTPVRGPGHEPFPDASPRKPATCFSLGVDSFHSLFTELPRPEVLVTCSSFRGDTGDPPPVTARLRSGVEAVAAEHGVRPVFFRSNLRLHPLHGAPLFMATHGSAQAAMGLLLAPEIHSLIIPSSDHIERSYPWGSSWLTDPHFSTGRVEIIHGDTTKNRDVRLSEILHEPSVRTHLCVCNEAPLDRPNCGVCEKCVRTRVALGCVGEAEEWPTFAGAPSLAASIDALPRVGKDVLDVWELMARHRLSPAAQQAIVQLLERTAQAERQKRSRKQTLLRRARQAIGL
jgi:hypothetical protein